jgi:hypothetical protein
MVVIATPILVALGSMTFAEKATGNCGADAHPARTALQSAAAIEVNIFTRSFLVLLW